MKRKKIFVLLVICTFILPTVFASDDWPMFRHDPQHTGYTDCEMPDELELLWKYETGDVVRSSPTVVNGKVYVGSLDNYIYCLDADNGNLLWKYKTSDYVFSSPTVVNGKVYVVGSRDNYIHCLDADNGNLLWKYETDDVVFSSPTVVNGKVYVGSWDNYIYCLGVKRETPPPPTTASPTTTAPPKQSNSLLYIGIFGVVIILILAVYQITKRKPAKEVEEPKKSSKKEIEKLKRKLKEDYVDGKISREEYLRRKEELEK